MKLAALRNVTATFVVEIVMDFSVLLFVKELIVG